MDSSIVTWGFAIIVGFPALLLILSFVAEQLERKGNPLAQVLRRIYLYVLPVLAVLLVARKLFQVPESQVSTRAIETIFWCTVLTSVLALLNAVLTTGDRKISWQIRVPNLLFQVARVLASISVAFYLLSGIWQYDLTNLVTALGVGSLAVALALQDTLSNLVSGFLLLLEGPIRVGDKVTIGDLYGEVIDLNWRSVRLLNGWGNVVVIPNGVVAKQTIDNQTLQSSYSYRALSLHVAAEHPPNHVKTVLQKAALSLDYVSEAYASVCEFDSYSIQYDIYYAIDTATAPGSSTSKDALLTCLYYAIKRHKLMIRHPIALRHHVAENPGKERDRTQEVREFLRSLPYFATLEPATLDLLVAKSRLDYYGVGDRVFQIGEFDEGIYVILEGGVRVTTMDVRNTLKEVSQLSKGDFFGELTLLVDEASPVSVTVTQDLTVIVITDELIGELLQRSPKLGVEIGQIIDESSKILRVVQGTTEILERQVTLAATSGSDSAESLGNGFSPTPNSSG